MIYMYILKNPVNPVKLTVGFQAIINQLFRIVAMKDSRCRSFSKVLQKIFRFVRDAACSGQTSDDLPLIMRNRELVEGTHRAGNEERDVARSNQHDVSDFQPKSRVDQRIASIDRKSVV